jgi:geranylgeranyl diphosphate synthase type II
MMVVSHDTAAGTRPTAGGASGAGAVPQALARVTSFIDPRLERALQLSSDAAPRLLEAMRYSLLAPGKRLRPALALWAAEACMPAGAAASPIQAWDTAAGAAVAVEMIHAYSLVHDDLPAMDDDDLRRGRPTCHRAFDEATAILCGDALQALAFETLVGSLPAAVAARGLRVLAQASGPEALVGGQSDDLAAERGWLDRSGAPEGPEEQVAWMERIHRRKTGALFRAALTLGGLAAGANDRQLAALDGYGRAFGLAFQIADDLLDAEGNEATTGKRVGKDAERGKLTYPTVLGLSESRRRAVALAAEAESMLSDLPASADDLRHLASWIVTRDH